MIRKIMFILLLLLLVSNVLAYDDQIVNALDEYYLSFMDEDLDYYMSLHYLDEYSEYAIQQKELSLQNLWNNIEVLELGFFDNLETDVSDNVAIARYTLDSKVNFPDGVLEESKNVTTLFIYQSGWKVVISGEREVIDGLLAEYMADVKTYVNTTGYDFSNSSIEYFNVTVDDVPEEVIPEVIPEEVVNDTIVIPTCYVDYSKVDKYYNFSIVDYPAISILVGDDVYVHFLTNTQEFNLRIKDKLVTKEKGDPDYIITTDDCTIARIIAGANPQNEYDEGNIKLKGASFGDKFKVGLAKVLYTIFSWFKKAPAEIWVEAETGVLTGGGQYTWLGASGRGDGEAYLGNGGAKVTYTIDAPKNGDYYFYISVSDDAKHASGKRDATFVVNGKEVKYSHISKNTITAETPWGWEIMGLVTLDKGDNVVTVTKDATTSAAFVMDRFVLSMEEMDFD